MITGRSTVHIAIKNAIIILAVLLLAACSAEQSESTDTDAASSLTGQENNNPALQPVTLETGEKLRVVATTGIIADVVSNVGGDAIQVTDLMPIGADPHSFTPTPQDLRALNDAHVIFINGLGLEESLLPILENLDRPVPMVSVNEGITPLVLDGEDNHESSTHNGDDDHHGNVDPHTWFSVPNVIVWTDNIGEALGKLDPSNADTYRAQATNYQAQLGALDNEVREQTASLPEENHKLVTDHVALAYLAAEYGFEEVGSVLPSLSTLAAASAQELAALQESIQERGVKALFVSTTVNPQTSSQIAGDLGIPVVEIYTGSLSDEDGPASTYIDLIRYDVMQIVEALK